MQHALDYSICGVYNRYMFTFTTSGDSIEISEGSMSSRNTELIAVTSGKGGVGKTLFSVNLAIEAVMMGKKTLILDGDLGMANVHIVTGVYPDHDIMDVVSNKKSIKDVIIKGPGGIDIIPGASGIFKLSNISHAKRHKFTEQLNELDKDYDLIILDTEAGMSHNVMKFISIADRTIVVATPDLTSLSDAYAIIKVMRMNKKSDDIGVVINRVRNAAEADTVFRKLNMASEKFLKHSLKNYGFVLEDPLTVKESIQKRSPISVAYPKTKVGNSLKQTAYRTFGMQDKKVVESSPSVILNRFSMLLDSVKV